MRAEWGSVAGSSHEQVVSALVGVRVRFMARIIGSLLRVREGVIVVVFITVSLSMVIHPD